MRCGLKGDGQLLGKREKRYIGFEGFDSFGRL